MLLNALFVNAVRGQSKVTGLSNLNAHDGSFSDHTFFLAEDNTAFELMVALASAQN